MQSKTVFQRFTIVVAGAVNNFILGIVLLFLMGIFYGVPETKPYLTNVNPKYNAYKVNIREGDLVKKVNGKKVRTIDDVMLSFQLVEEGSTIKFVLEDKNGNEKWDTGNYQEQLQPEKVYYFNKKIKFRKNWDVEEEWDIKEYPIHEQRPSGLSSSKTRKAL